MMRCRSIIAGGDDGSHTWPDADSILVDRVASYGNSGSIRE